MGRVALVAGERQMARVARGQREPRGGRQRHQTGPGAGAVRMRVHQSCVVIWVRDFGGATVVREASLSDA